MKNQFLSIATSVAIRIGEDWSGPEAANAWANAVAEPEADAAESVDD